MWIQVPDGHQIEIMEMAPNCIQAEAVRNLHAGGHAPALSAVLSTRVEARANSVRPCSGPRASLSGRSAGDAVRTG
jgi:hypothetical protein